MLDSVPVQQRAQSHTVDTYKMLITNMHVFRIGKETPIALGPTKANMLTPRSPGPPTQQGI